MVWLTGEMPWRRGAVAGGFERGECTIDRLVGRLLPEVTGGAEYAARPGSRLDEEPVAAVRTRQRIDPHPIGEAPYRIFPIWHVERVDRRCALRARRGIVAVVIESDAPPQPVVRLSRMVDRGEAIMHGTCRGNGRAVDGIRHIGGDVDQPDPGRRRFEIVQRAHRRIRRRLARWTVLRAQRQHAGKMDGGPALIVGPGGAGNYSRTCHGDRSCRAQQPTPPDPTRSL